MRELTDVMQQLREVRVAKKRFLSLWAVEQTVILPALDRVAADISDADMPPMGWNATDLSHGPDETYDGLHK